MSRRGQATPSIGRFAPSPTGELHFGSLVAAVASFVQVKCRGGKWLIRIEDIDPPREVAGSATRIIQDLAEFGMRPDGPVLFQSTRTRAYEAACARLLASGQAYWCGCSRQEISASGVYPGTCRNGIPKGRKPRAVRLRVDSTAMAWHDQVQGFQSEVLETTSGDFVIRRADGLYAYQLAVVVDDAFQEMTQIVRGADLLDSTARQIWLQQSLGLATPEYAHVPVAVSPNGRKLSKRLQSDPIRQQSTAQALRAALAFLGHDAPEVDVPGLWDWACSHWSLDRIPGSRQSVISSAIQPGSPTGKPGDAGRL